MDFGLVAIVGVSVVAMSYLSVRLIAVVGAFYHRGAIGTMWGFAIGLVAGQVEVLEFDTRVAGCYYY